LGAKGVGGKEALGTDWGEGIVQVGQKVGKEKGVGRAEPKRPCTRKKGGKKKKKKEF